MPNELNPQHPVTREMREQYHKLLAIAMWKFGLGDSIEITSDDIERFVAAHPGGINVTIEPVRTVDDPQGKTMKIRVVDDVEAKRLLTARFGVKR